MLMSAGLIGVFVADMRSRQVRDVKLLAQAVTFIAVFYDGLVVPGALLLLASGTWLIISYYGGWRFLKNPPLVGMVVLFGLILSPHRFSFFFFFSFAAFSTCSCRST